MSNYTIKNPDDVLGGIPENANITDFSIILGASRERGSYMAWARDRCGSHKGLEYYYRCMRDMEVNWFSKRCGVLLPVSLYDSSVEDNCKKIKKLPNGFIEIEYGYYPQTIAKQQNKLNDLFTRNELLPTGNTYTIDSVNSNNNYERFKPRTIEEYKYGVGKYVRVKTNFYGNYEKKLSDNETYFNNSYVWVKVEPVRWIVNTRTNEMMTRDGIFSGIQFSDVDLKRPDFYDEEIFKQTNIKKFLDRYLSKELETGIIEQKYSSDITTRKSRLDKMNPDIEKKANRRNITDTEMIHNWIENGESVLLRGPSGIGKTQRIRTLYPDAIELKLTNNMFPEKVVGSTNIQTGEEIPPNYAKQIILRLADDKEKADIEENIQNIYGIADQIYERSKVTDKKIVVLLDELLNVNPSIQSLVYTLVLNRFVESGKGIKLPKNVVVVATGNQKKYSSVAEDLAKPLEKRFDHILDMQPKVGEWLTEYAIPNSLHPAVIGYIFSKYNATKRDENIDTIGYFYEEPEIGETHLDEYGCEGKTNDPRGWTAISNMLYNFEENFKVGKYSGKDVEDILHRILDSKLRFEWSREFFDFYNRPVLTPEEVVCGLNKPNGYTKEDLPKDEDINARFAYMIALLSAKEDQLEACRNFIRDYCDPEYLAIYDLYWAGNDEKRMEKIGECKIMDAINYEKNESMEGEEIDK